MRPREADFGELKKLMHKLYKAQDVLLAAHADITFPPLERRLERLLRELDSIKESTQGQMKREVWLAKLWAEEKAKK